MKNSKFKIQNSILISLGIVLGCLLVTSAATAATNMATVIYQAQSFTGQPLNRQITISLLTQATISSTAPNNPAFGTPRVLQPVAGTVTTNLLPGNYVLQIDQIPAMYPFSVPDSTNTYYIWDLVNRGIYVLSQSNLMAVAAGGNVMVNTNGSGTVFTVSAPAALLLSIEGDSNAALTNSDLPNTNTWADLVAASPLIQSIATTNIFNWATPSDTASNMVSEYATQAHTVSGNAANRKVFILQAGVNDIQLNFANSNLIIGYVSNIWKSARSDGYKVMAMTITPATYSSWTVSNPDWFNQVAAINNWIVQATNQWDYLVRPDLLILTNGTVDLASGIHYNASSGAPKVAAAVIQALTSSQGGVTANGGFFNGSDLYLSSGGLAPMSVGTYLPGIPSQNSFQNTFTWSANGDSGTDFQWNHSSPIAALMTLGSGGLILNSGAFIGIGVGLTNALGSAYAPTNGALLFTPSEVLGSTSGLIWTNPAGAGNFAQWTWVSGRPRFMNNTFPSYMDLNDGIEGGSSPGTRTYEIKSDGSIDWKAVASGNGSGITNAHASVIQSGATGDSTLLTNGTLRPFAPDEVYPGQAIHTHYRLYSQLPLRVAYITELGNAVGYDVIYRSLNPFMDAQGFAIADTGPARGNYAYYTISGLNTNPSFDGDWPESHVHLGNGAAITFANDVSSGYPGDTVDLHYQTLSGGGTLTFLTNRVSNGTYGTLGVVNCSGTAGNGFWTNWTIPSAPDYGWKVTSSGTNIFIGAQVYKTNSAGYRQTTLGTSGQEKLWLYTSVPVSTFSNFWYGLSPDLIIVDVKDSAAGFATNMPTLISRWHSACPGADVLWLTACQNLDFQQSLVAQARDVIINAVRTNQLGNNMVCDSWQYFSPTNFVTTTNGVYADVSHETTAGGFLDSMRVPRVLGITPADLSMFGYTRKARGVSFANSTETNFIGLGTASPSARFDVVDTGFSSSSHFSFGTVPGVANYPAIYLDLGNGGARDFPSTMAFYDSGAHGYVFYYPSNCTAGYTWRAADGGDWNPGGFPTRDRARLWASGGLELIASGYSANNPGAGGIFVGAAYQQASNALSAWPTAPLTRGGFAIVSSNGYPYILFSTNGGIGSLTWTGTNKLGW